MVQHACLLRIAAILALFLSLPFYAMNVHAQQPRTILVIGDSLSAEYGLKQGTGWVALLQEKLHSERRDDIRVVNVSISGDTTAGGRSRLGRAIEQHQPAFVIIELGANDALRGLSLSNSKSNLQSMIEMSKASGAAVLLLGIQVPSNYGKAYMAQFSQMYKELAQEHGVALVPFFLAGVADVPEADQLFQRDRTHPNEAAQPIILQNMLPQVLELIKE
ncbi:MAG: arylesterase [Saezia sp.]